jgi:histidinol-phosphate aminotransferase
MLKPKLNLEGLPAAIHGGLDYREIEALGLSPEEVLDFSVCTNPCGPPPGIREALAQVPIDRYPDSGSTELRRRLADRLAISPDRILIGSGSTEIIRLIALAYLGEDDTALVLQPTYGEYELSCRLAGARVIRQTLSGENGFRMDIGETLDRIRKEQPKCLFLCNPNNPTGQILSREDIGKILTASPESLVVLDEAYIAFSDALTLAGRDIAGENLVILRSMTKDYALAGLRLGYGIARGPVISVLQRVQPPWSVSAAAQAAGLQALQAPDYPAASWKKIREAKDFLIEGLVGLGITPVPSAANFFLIKVGEASRFRKALLRQGVLVRDCASFGLPGYLRLAPRTIPECRKLLAAFAGALRPGL